VKRGCYAADDYKLHFILDETPEDFLDVYERHASLMTIGGYSVLLLHLRLNSLDKPLIADHLFEPFSGGQAEVFFKKRQIDSPFFCPFYSGLLRCASSSHHAVHVLQRIR
jgi:hypothetical protein